MFLSFMNAYLYVQTYHNFRLLKPFIPFHLLTQFKDNDSCLTRFCVNIVPWVTI